jgi:hypothetical protein
LVRPVTATPVWVQSSAPCVTVGAPKAFPHESPATHHESVHPTAETQLPSSTSDRLHTPFGSSVVSRPPELSPATQNRVVVQARESTGFVAPDSTVLDHPRAPSAVSPATTSWLESSTAAQKLIDGQDSATSLCPASIASICQELWMAGVWEVSTSPASSVATQKLSAGQDSEVMDRDGSTGNLVQAADPPVGTVATKRLPLPSPITHRSVDAHDAAVTHPPTSTSVCDQTA